jgi:hypothetical protein
MNLTPEIVKAAETVKENPLSFGESSQILATAILKHRSDYDSNCEPLPVDEAFIASLLGNQPHGTWFFGNKPYTVQVRFWRGVAYLATEDDEVGYVTFAKASTRPQIRSLLAALGGGT